MSETGELGNFDQKSTEIVPPSLADFSQKVTSELIMPGTSRPERERVTDPDIQDAKDFFRKMMDHDDPQVSEDKIRAHLSSKFKSPSHPQPEQGAWKTTPWEQLESSLPQYNDSFWEAYVNEERKVLTETEGLFANDEIAREKLFPIILRHAEDKVVAARRINRLESRVFEDPLTGLRNSAYAQTELLARISDQLIARNRTAMLFIDVDKFKTVNDTLGHKVGDQKLIDTANILRGAVRSIDTIVRKGGDEFVILLEDTDPQTAYLVAERIRTLGEANGLEGSIPTTFSIGLATFGEDSEVPSTPEEFIDWADRAMYNSKQDRNKVSVFDQSMQEIPEPNGTRTD
ncbi:MAG: GGDEF domain-containing protein [Candidatus Levybacteria bacterium]|nr:GGDEF domain-containing protein [Candidatus Levybacteria bacterium]